MAGALLAVLVILVAPAACASPRNPPALDADALGIVQGLVQSLLGGDGPTALQTSEPDPHAVLLASAVLRRAGAAPDTVADRAAVDRWAADLRERSAAGSFDGRDVVAVRAAAALGLAPGVAPEARELLIGAARPGDDSPAAHVVELATIMRADVALDGAAPDAARGVARAVREALRSLGLPCSDLLAGTDPISAVVIGWLLARAEPACAAAGASPTPPSPGTSRGSLDEVLAALDRFRLTGDGTDAAPLRPVLLGSGPYRGGLAQPLDVVFEIGEELATLGEPVTLSVTVERVLRDLVLIRGALPDVPEPAVSSDTVLAQALAQQLGTEPPAADASAFRWRGEPDLRADIARRTAALLTGGGLPAGLRQLDDALLDVVERRPGVVLPLAFVALGTALRQSGECLPGWSAALSEAVRSVDADEVVTSSTLVWLLLLEPVAARCPGPAGADGPHPDGVGQVLDAAVHDPTRIADATAARAAAVATWIAAERSCRANAPASAPAEAAALSGADVGSVAAAAVEGGGPGVLASLYMEMRSRSLPEVGCDRAPGLP